MKSKVSLITICYNDPFLEKTCESIVNQTWQDFEWVVVDGGSNQETLDIFEKYKSRIDKLFQSLTMEFTTVAIKESNLQKVSL